MNVRNTVKEKQTADSLGFHKCQSHTETLSTAAEDMELFLEKKNARSWRSATIRTSVWV